MSVIFKIFIFQKRQNEDKTKIFFYFGGPDKGLTLLLRISIRDRKSGLCSSLKNYLFDIFYFLKVSYFFILKMLYMFCNFRKFWHLKIWWFWYFRELLERKFRVGYRLTRSVIWLSKRNNKTFSDGITHDAFGHLEY